MPVICVCVRACACFQITFSNPEIKPLEGKKCRSDLNGELHLSTLLSSVRRFVLKHRVMTTINEMNKGNSSLISLKAILNSSLGLLQDGRRGEEERGGGEEEEGAVFEQQTTNGTFQKGKLYHFRITTQTNIH